MTQPGEREDLSVDNVEAFITFVSGAADLFDWADDDSVWYSLCRASEYVGKVKFFRAGGSYDNAVLAQAEVLAGDPLTRVVYAGMFEVFHAALPAEVLASVRARVKLNRGV